MRLRATLALWGATLTLAVALGAGLASAAPAPGAAPRTWGIAPVAVPGAKPRGAFNFALMPGASLSDAVEITNFSNAPITLDVYATDAFNTASGGFDVLPAAKPPTGVGTWVRLNQRTITLNGGERIDMPFTVNVPASAEPGDHAGGIVASLTTDGVDAAGAPLRLDHRVGARIYLRLAGALRESLTFRDVRLDYDGTLNPLAAGRATLTYTVRNAGNVRVRAGQRIKLAGIFGLGSRTVTVADLPELLPGSSVTRSVRINRVWPMIRFRGTATVGAKADAVTASASAMAIPWTAVVLVLGGLSVAGVRRARTLPRAREA